jgi:hypothetical protein
MLEIWSWKYIWTDYYTKSSIFCDITPSVGWKSIDVSEKYVASIFSVEEIVSVSYLAYS